MALGAGPDWLAREKRYAIPEDLREVAEGHASQRGSWRAANRRRDAEEIRALLA